MSAAPEVIQMPVAVPPVDVPSIVTPNVSISMPVVSNITFAAPPPQSTVVMPSVEERGITAAAHEEEEEEGGPAKRMRIESESEVDSAIRGPSSGDISSATSIVKVESPVEGEAEGTRQAQSAAAAEGEEAAAAATSGATGEAGEAPATAAASNSMDLLVSAALACDDEILLWDKHKANQAGAAGASSAAPPGAQPDIEIVKMFRRLSGIHTPRTLATAELRWCVVCNDRRPRVCCVECGVGLCTNGSGKDNCWSVYHTEERYVTKKTA